MEELLEWMEYIELKNGIPSHDTIYSVMGMLSPEVLQQLYSKCQELLNRKEGETLKKIICIDGKTIHSNGNKKQKANHIVSVWSKEDGFCLGQKAVEEKSNEMTAIPKLLEQLQIKGQVVTIDAMGTQIEIAETIRKKRADYVLSVKRNQGILYEEEKETLKEKGNYKRTIEKAHGQIEIREYYQTETIRFLTKKKEWKGLKSIGMEEKTIKTEEGEKKEYRYYISSLKEETELFSRAIRGHWSVESMHWHLDVTFKEDANMTLDKQAAMNQNIIRKWCLSALKIMELYRPKLSMKKKRFLIGLKPVQYLEEVLKL